ncbi:nuclear pore complex protein NUP98A-like [Impatiens glandulifera]|uniref:nuclear pore complex protein NUP98A-like n=1 Tax=Impatiens glandulifera TaxID=253017 RepID=UPI001FB17544|nr:nuclear pore complex protein NUP98A-like [Impatiens glandulifera]
MFSAGSNGAQASTPTLNPAFGHSPYGISGTWEELQQVLKHKLDLGGQREGSRATPYAPETESDTQHPGKLVSISAMKSYKNKNHEELRWEDHQLGDKGGPWPASQSPGTVSFCGTTPQENLFAATSSSPFVTNTPGLDAGFGSSPFVAQASASTPTPFGASSTAAFGAKISPALGVSSTTAFSVSSTPSFSFGSSPAFGKPVSAFGGSPNPFGTSTTPFGSQSSPFETQATSPNPTFGSTPFGKQPDFEGQLGGSKVTPYAPSIDIDLEIPGHFVSISAMSFYKDKSHEELRWEDYQLGDKETQATSPNSTLGSTPFGKQPDFEGQLGGSKVTPYAPSIDIDSEIPGHFVSISAMSFYKDKSHEELRWEDYQLGDKESQATTQNPTFGSTPFVKQPGFEGQLGGSKVTPYAPSIDIDSEIPGHFVSLSAMSFYKDKSHEELRWEDYQLSDKGKPLPSSQSSSSSSFGGTTPQGNPFTATFSFGQASSSPFTSTTVSNPFAPKTPAFGVSSTPAFGVSSTPSFSFGSSPAFGQPISAFGLSPNPFGTSTTPFGCQSSPFETQAPTPTPTPTLGSTPFGKQPGFEGQLGGSKVTPYAPSIDIDSEIPGHFVSISAMSFYKDKSHEELRWEDYQLGDKETQAPTPTLGSTPFGKQPGFEGQLGGSKVTPYESSIDIDSEIPGHFVSISAMSFYKDKSHEELRWEDYQLSDKGKSLSSRQSSSTYSFGGTTPQGNPFTATFSFGQASSSSFTSNAVSNPIAPKTPGFGDEFNLSLQFQLLMLD